MNVGRVVNLQVFRAPSAGARQSEQLWRPASGLEQEAAAVSASQAWRSRACERFGDAIEVTMPSSSWTWWSHLVPTVASAVDRVPAVRPCPDEHAQDEIRAAKHGERQGRSGAVTMHLGGLDSAAPGLEIVWALGACGDG